MQLTIFKVTDTCLVGFFLILEPAWTRHRLLQKISTSCTIHYIDTYIDVRINKRYTLYSAFEFTYDWSSCSLGRYTNMYADVEATNRITKSTN